MSSVRFNYADIKPISLTKKSIIKEFVADIFLNEGKSLQLLNYIFCSDNYLLEINKTFLNHNFFTDVISFDLSEGVTTIGEVYISVDRVKENAFLHSTAFTEELLRVIFHGALHLCGYKDKKKSEIITIRQKEDYYLQLLQKKNLYKMFHVKRILFIAFLVPFSCLAQHLGSTSLPVKAMPALPSNNVSILRFLDSCSEYNSLSPVQKEWFYWTNYSRSNPKQFWDSVVFPIITNYPTLNSTFTQSLKTDLYNSSPLPYVKPNINLLKTSQAFAGELSSKNAPPSHTSPSGSTFPDRMKASGIINCAGENISYGPINPVLMLVLLYIDEGVPNLGHRHTLLNPTFVEMGIGVAKYVNNNSIVIQDFACNQK